MSRYTRAELSRQRHAVGRLAAWSVVEALPGLVAGIATARAVDAGFLAGRPVIGVAWLAGYAVAAGLGAIGSRQAYRCLAGVVEPVRDRLAARVVTGELRRATAPGGLSDGAAVARLTHQVEIVRDTLAGLLTVARGFLFGAVAALAGLLLIEPRLAGLVTLPLLVGLVIFLALLPAMVTRQRRYVLADERLGRTAGAMLRGHRDIAAGNARDWAVSSVGAPIDAQYRAELSLARMGALRRVSLAVSGWLPLVVILLAAPWAVRNGAGAGAVLGAIVYVRQGLQPALHLLIQGLASGGLRYGVTLARLLAATAQPALIPPTANQPVVSRPVVSRPVVSRPVVSRPVVSRPAVRQPAASPAPAGPTPARGQPTAHVGLPVESFDLRPAAAGQSVASSGDDSTLSGGDQSVMSPDDETAALDMLTVNMTSTVELTGLDCVHTHVQPRPSGMGRRVVELDGVELDGVELDGVELDGVERCGAALAAGELLRMQGVSFRYGPAAEPVLDGFDLEVREGEHLAIVGASGIGKSTLSALMAGLLAPQAGTVRVGRAPVLLPQEAYVFTGTVEENLRYLAPEASAASLDEAVDVLGARTLLDRLGGYAARLEPATLSAGERQVLALVRAYLSPAPLAVLDEATCHLDPAGEERAELAFAERPGALVVIAHRMTSARRARRILMFDGSRPELGDHESLLAQSAAYRELVGHWSDPAGFLGDVDGLDAVAGAGLGQDARQVVAHGAGGERQLAGDLLDRGAERGDREDA
ncbi:ATP-binding cassette domain-containing protein [Paractinoplanes rishiriensis]|uniref:ATP-binding cassette domain-containing protein n=1 Tax=Paractinoplanes rishiriensis TaxID=1050105 RepID=UPI001EF2294C|nr:ATP-binding cassette domain-containing protein [Actinoplanes rishiriensis]